jgi:carboxyl-terminal processing protease
MTSRTRIIVLSISAPVIVFAIVGGFLGKVMAREDKSYQGLKMFDDVTQAITSSYVEPVNVDKVMNGAMRGLADGLDPDSAYLSPQEVKQAESGAPLSAGDVGVELTRQYYLRIIAARDNSPAAKAGLRTGDYVRMIDSQPTRDMSVWEGVRALHGAPGSKVKLTIIRGNAVDPHIVELTREAPVGPDVTSKMAAPGVGYVRLAAIGPKAAEDVKSRVADLQKNGATRLIVDVRRNSTGSFDAGIELARLFVAKGTLTVREARVGEKQTIAAASGDGSIALPTELLIDTGTSGAAELFASALAGNQRAELIGEHTIGRAATQKLIKLPDGSGLWLSTTRFLTPSGGQLHEKGLEPTVVVDQPDVEFGQPAPASDPVLDKALEHAAGDKTVRESVKKAA